MKNQYLIAIANLFIITFSFNHQINAQTIFSGGIYTNTTWSAAESPFIITDDVVVFPGNSLTIEAGVIVKFDTDAVLEIRNSNLYLLGTTADSITLTSNAAVPARGDWQGILLVDTSYINLQFCNISFANKAIDVFLVEDNIEGYIVTGTNSTFTNNTWGIEGSDQTFKFENCIFDNNLLAFGYISTPSPDVLQNVISNCVFSNNENGLSGNNTTVKDSRFCNNLYWACFSADTIINCQFTNNSGEALKGGVQYCSDNIFYANNIGVDIGFGYAYTGQVFSNNYIYNNTIGIRSGFETSPDLSGNNICNNETNIEKTGITAGAILNVCFCETDSTIIASQIYDGYDDVSIGLLSFIPYSICDSSVFDTLIIEDCDEIMLPINDELHINDFECKVFPNPTSEILNIEILGLTTNASGMILTILGEKQMDFTVTGKSQLNISSLAEGIYVLQLIANGKTTAIKFIKTK